MEGLSPGCQLNGRAAVLRGFASDPLVSPRGAVQWSEMDRAPQETRRSLGARLRTVHTDAGESSDESHITSPFTRKSHVLVIDDDPVNLLVFRRALERRGYEVITADSAEAANDALAIHVPDIVLLDIFMPKTSGFEFLAELRDDIKTASVPVILISALADTNHIVEGLDRGANDYITKPVVIPILTARIEALLRASALVKSLEVQKELLAKLAAFDDLTGLYNRRSLFHAFETELARCQRYRRGVSILMVDIDRFKDVNDRHGHRAGDEVLRQVADSLIGSLRTIDVVCRYGGEEFCIVLPETQLEGAVRAAERVRAAIEARPFSIPGVGPLRVTVSVGVASWAPDGTMLEPPDLLAEADAALLAAKRAGRNSVRPMAEPKDPDAS
jgi:diguanylate cyclase (GGDEF)-like protein